ncbi:QLQ domain-containing protein [Trichonephila clavipes]|nr:QLQ domain-containing protein [Trichonephila clavipes]
MYFLTLILLTRNDHPSENGQNRENTSHTQTGIKKGCEMKARSSKVHQELVLAAGLSIERVLKNLGFHGRAAAHKPNITPQNAKHRLQWCRARRHWTVDLWKTVLWSDESRFTVCQSDERVWV